MICFVSYCCGHGLQIRAIGSGTDMQVEKMRVCLDENGHFVYLTPPTYANDTDADADSNLPSKAFYKITGNRTLFQKP